MESWRARHMLCTRPSHGRLDLRRKRITRSHVSCALTKQQGGVEAKAGRNGEATRSHEAARAGEARARETERAREVERASEATATCSRDEAAGAGYGRATP